MPVTRLADPERAALQRLLHVRAAGHPSPGAAAPDWPALLDYAGVALGPLLAHGLRREPPDHAPADILATLREQQLAQTRDYLRRHAALRGGLAALAAAGIPVLVIKGAALAHLVYPDPAMRTMMDLDLWVPPARLDEAEATLAAHGFVTTPAAKFPAFAPPSLAQRELSWSTPSPVHVELHSHLPALDGVRGAGFDDAWASGFDATLAGAAARVPSRELLLAHVCLHLARSHAFATRLLPLVDIALLVRRWERDWDWPAMAAAWERDRIAAWMLLALTLSRDLLGAPVPDALEARAAPAEFAAMRSLALERVWEGHRHRLPPVMRSAVGGGGGTLHMLRRRVVDYYWSAPGDASPVARITGAAKRLWYDVRIKVPRYVMEWRRGLLRGPALERAIDLERGRAELERLVIAGGGLGYAEVLAANRPDAGNAIARESAAR